MNNAKFSIVIPVYNEEDNIPLLYRRLTRVMEELCSREGFPLDRYEIILVDDGSRDRSWSIIQELRQQDERIRGMSFSRNFGHHIAITAGLDHANGDAVILMDGDLQDPPEEIPKLWERLKEGYDIVYGIRKEKKDSIIKRFNSSAFWWFINKLSGLEIPKNQTLLRIFDRKILDVLKSMREQARFIHGMIAWTGFRVFLQQVEHAPRTQGVTKYNTIKLFMLAFNAITSLSTVPLRLATYLGMISSGFGLLSGLFFLYRKFMFDIPVLGYASTIVAVLFIGGVQLLILGILGEYIGRIYHEVQKRPIYVLKDSL